MRRDLAAGRAPHLQGPIRHTQPAGRAPQIPALVADGDSDCGVLGRAADLLQDYEAKIAALERMVGRQALEIEFLKGALKNAPRTRSASTSVITGPAASPLPKDAG